MLSEKGKKGSFIQSPLSATRKNPCAVILPIEENQGPAKILEIQRILNLQLGKIHFKVLFFHLISSSSFFIFKECYLLHFLRERVCSCLISVQIMCQLYICVKMHLFQNASIYHFLQIFQEKKKRCIHFLMGYP